MKTFFKKNLVALVLVVPLILSVQIAIDGGWSEFYKKRVEKEQIEFKGKSAELSKPPVGKKRRVYKRKDEKGNYVYTNVKPAVAGIYTSVKEISYNDNETRIRFKNGVVLVPVTISNAGNDVNIEMVLDTGCSITFLPPTISEELGVLEYGTGVGVIADGSEMKMKRADVDSLTVGPFMEINFLVSIPGQKVNRDNVKGLLGMNFLHKHPFRIDRKKKAIIWL